ncbi:MmgE/PrpD family protein [[Erwinia] mediterraneensis]|uniref:MmgE/PrpD family protein n=1 Tax=[Erwinia] mediterraneensis TaxID=2161819 RepID=UPI00102FFF75|nr:MmgE/PrpD family protein [[Erwinia] mediterraneensis]
MGQITLLSNLVDQALSHAVFPESARVKAAICFLDFLSCTLESAHLPWSQQVRDIAAKSSGVVPVAGDAVCASAEEAAFANAVRGHGLVREDMHTGSISHMGVVIWPVLISLAAENPALNACPLAAAILGYELGGRIGRALITPAMARHFRPTGLIGPLAATLAGAALLQLDREKTINALAFAANAFGGLNEWPHSGADEMYYHPGFAARNAITALRLAMLGAQGSASALDGQAGLFAAFAIPLKEPLSLFPQDEYEITTVFNKEVPACNFAQSPCQVALAAVERIKNIDEIKRIELSTCQAAINYPGCAWRGPFNTPLQAKMSIYFGVAATLAQREIAESNYARLEDERIARLIEKITLKVSADLDSVFPARQGAAIRIETLQGEVIHESLEDVRAASPEQVINRLKQVASERLSAAACSHLTTAITTLSTGEATAEHLLYLVRLCSGMHLSAGCSLATE